MNQDSQTLPAASPDPQVQAASNIISVSTKSYNAYFFATKAGRKLSDVLVKLWREGSSLILRYEHMNKKVHGFQKPKNFSGLWERE